MKFASSGKKYSMNPKVTVLSSHRSQSVMLGLVFPVSSGSMTRTPSHLPDFTLRSMGQTRELRSFKYVKYRVLKPSHLLLMTLSRNGHHTPTHF